MALDVIVLAAGQGTRMKSSKAKVLQEIAGRPMLEHVLLTARSLDAERIAVVVGHQKEAVKENFNTHSSSDLVWVDQNKRLGTGPRREARSRRVSHKEFCNSSLW